MFLHLIIKSPYYPFLTAEQFDEFIEKYEIISENEASEVVSKAYSGVLKQIYLKKGEQD